MTQQASSTSSSRLAFAVKAVAFLTGLVLLLGAAQFVVFARHDRDELWGDFLELPAGSVEALFLGSSLVHANINPAVLWEGSGVRSYDLSGSEQSLATTRHYLDEALRTQSPQVVVLDLHMFSIPNLPLNENQKRSNHTMMPLGPSKLRALYDAVPATEWAGYILPLVQFHSRWAELEREDFRPGKWAEHSPTLFMGYRKVERVEPQEVTTQVRNVDEGLYETNYRMLEAIVDSAEQGGAEVLLVVGPSTRVAVHDKWIARLEDDLARDHPSVKILETQRLVGEMGIDYQTDYYDDLHLNNVGAEKYSKWLGQRLSEMYGIGSSPDEALDAPWRRELERYRAQSK